MKVKYFLLENNIKLLIKDEFLTLKKLKIILFKYNFKYLVLKNVYFIDIHYYVQNDIFYDIIGNINLFKHLYYTIYYDKIKNQ